MSIAHVKTHTMTGIHFDRECNTHNNRHMDVDTDTVHTVAGTTYTVTGTHVVDTDTVHRDTTHMLIQIQYTQ